MVVIVKAQSGTARRLLSRLAWLPGVAKSYPPFRAELLALVEGGGTDRVARHGKAQEDSQVFVSQVFVQEGALLGDDCDEACED